MLGQFVVNGLITGMLYSLLAIGFALVYNTTRIFHIAAAGVYVFAAYMFYLFAVQLAMPLFAAALVAAALTMALSLLMETSVYRPLKQRRGSHNAAMIASIGLMTVVVNVVALFFGNETRVVENSTQHSLDIHGIILTMPQVWQLCAGGILIVVLLLSLRFTSWGLRMRALSADEVLFETLGYNTRGMRNLVFLMSGAVIAAASCLTVYDIGMAPTMGMNVLISAIVAMVIGGTGRFGACVVGGLTLGVLQSLTVYWVSSNWQNAVTFVVLLIFLFLRPQGIAGYKQRTV